MVEEEKRAARHGEETAASYNANMDGLILRITIVGNWSVTAILNLDAGLRAFAAAPPEARMAVFDLAGVTRLDTAGAWLLGRTAAALDARGIRTSFEAAREEFALLIEKVRQGAQPEEKTAGEITLYDQIAGRIGAAIVATGHEAVAVLGFFGAVVGALGRCLRQPKRLRFTPLVHHMEKAGFDALPLVCLLTFLIGAVIAQQGATQLSRFGADVFTVNLVAIVFLREVGILLTAIIVAGRSGSAFTAEIGSMKMREEIDAMRTLGLDPLEMLVLPRVLALVVTLPLLTFVADIMGLVGGGVVASFMLGMSPEVYIERLRGAVEFWTFGVGILKAPFMALVIALVGCQSGLEVTGSAESVGAQTTRSVVRSIFLVIILDAMFAMFFTAINI